MNERPHPDKGFYRMMYVTVALGLLMWVGIGWLIYDLAS